ncbi:MAG: hypothetical protein CMJ80_09315 [Planctomycetaceae bacterium]|nr:hypothetical protein [Planctomycetaceae bacterium]
MGVGSFDTIDTTNRCETIELMTFDGTVIRRLLTHVWCFERATARLGDRRNRRQLRLSSGHLS